MKDFPSIRAGALLAALLISTGAGFPEPAGAVTYLEQAERIQQVYAYLIDYRPAGAPRVPKRGLIEVQAEVIPTPEVDHRVGAKDEPFDPPAALPRVRAKYIASWGLMLGATASPPVEAMGFSAPWVGAEAGLRAALGAVHGELRGYWISAQVTGPLTDTSAQDEFEVINRGYDLRLGLDLGAWMPYGGAGRGHSTSQLTIESDGAVLEAEGNYAYWMAGITYAMNTPSAPLLFTVEQNGTEDVLYHIILAAAVQF